MAKIKNPDTKVMWNYFHHVAPKSDTGWEKGTFHKLTRDQQIKIAQYACPWFNPPCSEGEDKKYSRKWWDGLKMDNGRLSDANMAAAWECLLPERTREGKEIRDTDYVPNPVDFYSEVTLDTAKDWYLTLPAHLRKNVDTRMLEVPSGAEAKRDDKLYEQVFQVWGDRPELPDEPKDELDGVTTDGLWRIEIWKEWVRMYDDLKLREVVVEMAPGIQKERRMLNQAMGLNVDAAELPSQAEGLEDTQAATVRWLQASGEMPLEFLARTYRSEDYKIGDRIQAAKTLMDYVHRKVPSKQEIETKDTTKPKLDPALFKGLTDKELDMLEKLLAKMSDSNG